MCERSSRFLRLLVAATFLATLNSGARATNVCPSVPLTPFPFPISQTDPVAHSRYVYVIGGYDGALSLNTVVIGTMHADGTISWVASPNTLPEADQGPSATIYNGWLYAVLGNGRVYRTQLMPDGSIGSWIDAGVGMAYRGGFMSAEAYDGYLYVMGGFGDGAGGCSMHSDVILAPINADGSVGAWTSTTAMPEPRQHQSVHFFNGRAYIVGGISGCTSPILATSFSAPVDPGTGLLGAWRAEASLPQSLWYHKSVQIGNEIVIFGGRTTYSGGESTVIYRGAINAEDGTIPQWAAQCGLPGNVRTAMGSANVESLGAIVLIGGSDSSNNPSNEVWRTDLPNACIKQGFWDELAPMPVVSTETSAVSVSGMIYVLGNNNGVGENNRIYRYDPATGTWEQLAACPNGRGQAGAAAVNGVIYRFGGNSCYGNCWVTTVDAYDIATNTWSTKTSLPGDGRGMLSAVAHNGKIYVMGGVNSYTVPTYSYNHIYDPATDSWSEGVPLPRPRSHHGATLLNGKIYLIGGDYRYAHDMSWTVPEVDVYDPVTDTWSVAPDAQLLRAECSAVTLNGRIYVMGGRTKFAVSPFFGNPTRRVEEFDPITNCWRYATQLPGPRARGSAVVVDDRVYFIGGSDASAPTDTLFVGLPLPPHVELTVRP